MLLPPTLHPVGVPTTFLLRPARLDFGPLASASYRHDQSYESPGCAAQGDGETAEDH